MKLFEISAKDSLILDIIQDSLDDGVKVYFDGSSKIELTGNVTSGWKEYRDRRKGRINRIMAGTKEVSLLIIFSEKPGAIHNPSAIHSGHVMLQMPVDEYYDLQLKDGALMVVDK